MRTLRLALVWTVIPALLVGLSGAVLAQTTEEETLDPMRASHFTGTWGEIISEDPFEDWAWGPGPTGSFEALGIDLVVPFETSDPRISGTWTQVSTMRTFPIDMEADTWAALGSGAFRIENEDGAWAGTYDGYYPGETGGEWFRAVGEEAYEGLTVVFSWVGESDTYEGFIIPGVPADHPAPIAAERTDSSEVPTAWSEALVEVLSDVGVIPLEAIPEDADHVTYARISVEPGVSGAGVGSHPQSWSNLEYVERGALSSTPETDRVYWRADGSMEEVPAGTAAEMRPGDTVLSWNGGAAGQFENSGPDAWASFFVGAGNSHDPEVEPELLDGVEWRVLDYIFPLQATVDAWFSAPIAARYERITWEPGAQLVLGSDEVPMLSFIWLESGRLRYDEVPADEVADADVSRSLFARGTWRGETPSGDTVYVLRNEDDELASGIGVTLSHAS